MLYCFRPTIMTGLSAPGRTVALLCLLILAGTFACTDSGEAPDFPSSLSDQSAAKLSGVGNIAPIRIISDRYPMFAGVGIDPINNKAVFSDDNTFSVLIYDRDNPGSEEHITEFSQRIAGPASGVSAACGITVSPENKELYVLNTDFGNNMLVFSYDQTGDVPPLRDLSVDHGGWGMYLDQKNDEMMFTIQHLNKISVYRPTAEGDEQPLRFIQGPNTKLVDPHGIFVDTVNDEIVVTNQHSSHQIETGVVADTLGFRHMLQSTGSYELPSITVYSRTAEGDARPLRTIQGPKTRMDLPLNVAVDPERNVIVVANDQAHAVLFFSRTAQGDVAPVGVLEGPNTLLANPGGLYIDTLHDEMWVTNWGDHSVTIYDRDARGNAAPLRTIRTAPKGEPVAGLGRPSAIAWDSRRDELLVPN